MSQPFKIDNTKRLYLLETDETYSIDSFKITHYFEISEKITLNNSDNYFKIFPEYEKDKSKIRVKGNFQAKIVEAFNINYDGDKVLEITNVEGYKKRYYSDNRKVFLVNEESINNKVQYLYSNDDNSEKEFVIDENDRIIINNCIKQPFTNFLAGDIADTDFLERVAKVEKYLSPLKDTIRGLNQKVVKDLQKGGGFEQAEYLKVDEEKNNHFHNMIDLYIRCVNEILNVPLFKKIFYLSHILIPQKTNDTIGSSSLELIKQFNYVGFFIQSLLNKEEGIETTIPDVLGNLLTGVEAGKLRDSSELFQDRFKGINHIVTESSTKRYGLEKEIFKDDKVYKEEYIVDKYNLKEEEKANIRIYNVTYFVNNILLPIKNADIKYHELFNKDDREDSDNKKMLGKFFYFILEIIEKEMKAIQLLIFTKDTFDKDKKERKKNELINNLKLDQIQQKINKLIGEQIDTNILTYLKIRNDQHNPETGKSNYNARFQIKIEDTTQTEVKKRVMELNYSDDNKEYYKKNDDDEIEPIENNDLYKTKENQFGSFYINPNDRDNYPRKYIFGEFNNIFTPEKSNKEIANQAKEITNNLMEGRPVFIIGYGASGAGKTSSLIYFNKKEEDGILVEICNIMGKKGFNKASIKSCEIYRDASVENAKMDITKNPENFDGDGISFSYDNGFTLDEELNYKNHHIFRARKQEQRKKEKELKERGVEVKSLTIENCEESITTTFAKDSQLGEYLIHIIDTDRHVKATTNNPNSSRSHSLVFVKLSGGGKEAHLIVGDFAGVENEFNCLDTSVLNDFMKIEADDGSGLFYKNEVCNDKLDPIGNTAKKKVMTGGENSYNFGQFLQDQPFSYSNLGQLTQLKDTIQKQTILQQYFGENFVNIDKFKTAVRLIRSIAGIQLDEGEEKNLIGPENVDTFNNYSELKEPKEPKEPKDNVWKKAKDGWNSYRESVKNIQEMIEGNEENDKNSRLKDQLYDLIDKTIELTEVLGPNSLFPMSGNPTSTPVSEEIINKFKFRGSFDSKKYKDNLFLFFAKVIENHGSSDLKTKLGNTDYANASIKFLTDNQLNNKDDFFTTLENKKEETYPFAKEHYPLSGKKIAGSQKVKKIIPGFMKTFKEILLTPEFAPKKSIFDENLAKYHQENIETNFINPKGKYNTVYRQLISPKVDEKPIFSVWTLDDIKDNLNDSQYKAYMKFIDNILGNEERELGPIGIYLIELELYTYEKLALANEVCSNRKQEGYLINNSLGGVRDMIRNILQAKNQSTLQLVPNYINICFDRYCPTHTNCFSFDTRNTKENTDVLDDKTVIYNTIKDYFHKENKSNRTPLSIENLVVGIFCVFNISQTANNPPPVPYVDINDLKRIVFNYNLFDEKYQNSKEGKKRITSFVLCAKELLDTIDNKFINTYKVGDSDQEKNLLETLKIGNPVNGFKELNLKDYQGNNINEDYNLYEIFKFLLNQLVNTREVAEDATKYATDMSDKSKSSISEQSVLVETMEKKTEEDINKLGDFEKEIINKINNQDIEINVNEVRKNEFTKIYQLNDLKKLVRFLKYDLERLKVAEGRVEVFEEDGYDGFDFINNNLEEEHREEFYSEYILSKHIIDVEKTWGNCDELERERVYSDLRQYIEKTIASLFKTIFRGKHEKKIIAELIEFDMSIFKSEIGFKDLKTIRDEKRTNMNNYLDNIQEEEARKKEDEARKAAADKLAEEQAKAAEEQAKTAEEQAKADEARKANLAQAKLGNQVRRNPDMLTIKKGIREQQKKRRGARFGGGGGAELTVTNIDSIINYIGERVQYMRSDAFNPEKIKELQNIIENYKGAINSLDNFIDYLNETINDYEARIMLISKDKIQLIKSMEEIDTEMGKMKEEKEKYNKLKERYIEEYKSIENGLKDKQKKAIDNAVSARNKNKLKYYNTQNKIDGVPLSKVFMHYLEEFLTSVDNVNAASAVGTLEFLDKMAKLNTVSTICNFNNSEIVESDLREKIGYNLKNLYEEITQ